MCNVSSFKVNNQDSLKLFTSRSWAAVSQCEGECKGAAAPVRGSADSHLILHAGSPRYRDLHVDILEEVDELLLLLSSALHRSLHSASGGRRRGVSRVCRPRGNAVQSVGTSCAGVVGLFLIVTGQDDWGGNEAELCFNVSIEFYSFLPSITAYLGLFWIKQKNFLPDYFTLSHWHETYINCFINK